MKKQTNPNIKAHLVRGAFYLLLLLAVGVIAALSSAINLPNHPPKLASPHNDTAFAANGQENASSVAASAIRRDRTLTFADRVAYQRAIEEVYWHHRIWPKENTASKPSLDAVMSQAQLEEKVAKYLRESRALELYWQRPITPEELQAEMDRIARNTRQPDTLREMFAALGNDAAVIAECVARPVLAERLVRDLSARDEQFRTQIAALASCTAPLQVNSGETDPQSPVDNDTKAPRLRTMAANEAVKYQLPAIIGTPNTTCFDEWVPTGIPDEVPARYLHTAVWTGSEMIVWGGNAGSSYTGGGRYNPTTDSWSIVSTLNEPLYRDYQTAVWTGSEMIIWGGFLDPNVGGGDTNSGGRYNPATDTWTATNTTDAPLGRGYHAAVWTGTEMIVWGGYDSVVGYSNTGGRYNPSTDSWTGTDATNAPDGRWYPTAVWTGTEMIVWGGLTNIGFTNSGGRYNPSTDSWTDTATNAPDARWFHTAVWTGSEMVVWGGENDGGVLNTGGRYDPITSTWAATTIANAPDARRYHTAVWSGNEMIVWGGADNGGVLNTGARYNPSTDSWTDTTTSNAPETRFLHTAVWTGTEMIVWGGANIASNALATGGRYCGQAVQVTIKTSPPGRTFSVDGTSYSSTQRFTWASGSSHTIATSSPQSGDTGVQYLWTKWSDHGAISHTVAPTTNTTYTATFKTQYYLTMTAGTGGRVNPASGWKNSGATVSISATPARRYSFSNWTGSGTGSYSGSNNPASITMGGPIAETATFIHN